MSDKKCKFCSYDIGERVSFHGLSDPYAASWVYLQKGESAHIECYIQECVKRIPKDKKEECESRNTM